MLRDHGYKTFHRNAQHLETVNSKTLLVEWFTFACTNSTAYSIVYFTVETDTVLSCSLLLRKRCLLHSAQHLHARLGALDEFVSKRKYYHCNVGIHRIKLLMQSFLAIKHESCTDISSYRQTTVQRFLKTWNQRKIV